jgi:hypothetical protein
VKREISAGVRITSQNHYQGAWLATAPGRERCDMGIGKRTTALMLAVCLLFLAAVFAYGGGEFQKMLKLLGVPWLVKEHGTAINKFFNTLTANKNLSTQEATKVVPIVSLGSGGHVGAAQVAGPQEKLNDCKAVLQIEGDWNSLRGNALVPVNESNPTKSPKRVKGVGVSAILEIKL